MKLALPISPDRVVYLDLPAPLLAEEWTLLRAILDAMRDAVVPPAEPLEPMPSTPKAPAPEAAPAAADPATQSEPAPEPESTPSVTAIDAVQTVINGLADGTYATRQLIREVSARYPHVLGTTVATYFHRLPNLHPAGFGRWRKGAPPSDPALAASGVTFDARSILGTAFGRQWEGFAEEDRTELVGVVLRLATGAAMQKGEQVLWASLEPGEQTRIKRALAEAKSGGNGQHDA